MKNILLVFFFIAMLSCNTEEDDCNRSCAEVLSRTGRNRISSGSGFLYTFDYTLRLSCTNEIIPYKDPKRYAQISIAPNIGEKLCADFSSFYND